MNRQVFLKLLALKLSGEISDEQRGQLETACAEHPEYQQLAAGILQGQPPANATQTDDALKAAWDYIALHQNDDPKEEAGPARRMISWKLYKLAAAILLFLIAGLLWYHHERAKINEGSLVLSAAGYKLYQTLDDGTTVYLNQQSSIRYNANFGKNKREISLRGEAFFDVAKNAAVPLLIRVGQITIEVKGTAFNVSERPQQKQVEIALIRGKIEVSNHLSNESHIPLNPQERMLVSAGKYLIQPLDTGRKTATLRWTRDSLVFKKEKLINLTTLLERKYKVKIQIKNEQLKLKRFSGVIKDEQLTEALDALKLSYPFSYTVNDQSITIK